MSVCLDERARQSAQPLDRTFTVIVDIDVYNNKASAIAAGAFLEKFCEERCTFLDYKDIWEYIEDIVKCLVYSSWHYSEERARRQC